MSSYPYSLHAIFSHGKNALRKMYVRSLRDAPFPQSSACAVEEGVIVREHTMRALSSCRLLAWPSCPLSPTLPLRSIMREENVWHDPPKYYSDPGRFLTFTTALPAKADLMAEGGYVCALQHIHAFEAAQAMRQGSHTA